MLDSSSSATGPHMGRQDLTSCFAYMQATGTRPCQLVVNLTVVVQEAASVNVSTWKVSTKADNILFRPRMHSIVAKHCVRGEAQTTQTA